jgi:fused-like protein
MFGNLMKIFLLYLQEAEKEVELIKAIYQSGLTELIIQFTRLLDAETINSLITFMVHLISFNNDKLPFIRQFIEASGMAIFVRFSLLKTDIYDNASIVESCNLLSQIARSSKDTYEHIASIDLYPDLKVLIRHPDPQIKSRVLNLLGNMCRHSNYFYAKLLEFDFIKDIIHLCSSDDKNIKKFACVALGNASFHDASLYEELRAGVPVLVGLLKDIDEKTRSNAAAALGNLARNSGMLDKEFVRTGANYQLVNMINNDKSLSAKKVSIMAVTNLLNLE